MRMRRVEEMVTTISRSLPTVPHLPQNANNGRKSPTTTSAKRKDSSDSSSSTSQRNEPKFPYLRVSNPTLARSVVSVLGLGFIDAGYSGDWSRIGVITTESEDLLKIAAFFVVPFCIFLIFSISRETDS